MATYSNILSWKIPQAEEPSIYSPWGHKGSRHNNIQQSDSDRDIVSHVPFHYGLLQDTDYSSPCLP